MQLERKRLSIAPFLLLVVFITVGFSFIFTYSQIASWEKELEGITTTTNDVLSTRVSLQEQLAKSIWDLDIDRDIIFEGELGDILIIFERIGNKPLEQDKEILKLEKHYVDLLTEIEHVEGRISEKVREAESLFNQTQSEAKAHGLPLSEELEVILEEVELNLEKAREESEYFSLAKYNIFSNTKDKIDSIDYSIVNEYNEQVTEFNNDISNFPYNIVAFFSGTNKKHIIPVK